MAGIDDYDGAEEDRLAALAEAARHAKLEAWDDLPTAEKQRLIALDYADQRERRNADEAARLRENAEAEREEMERSKREHARWRGDR